ncbi:DUF3152 domain-containing protein [Streptomyces sp. Z38]|uniref:DUF3152 domain-containing protein n=1 Tax=Streptomyces sp. Z38 TaxID=2682780 RepID=UPI0012EACC0B|nr:DUF3152 domain-containing protein [Streptomyces sp. Z38]MUT88718.1 DUF3152 domain-containing protein [Streptomyces sp. Z38]
MGRHSRRGPAPKGDTADTTTTAAAAARGVRDAPEAGYDDRRDTGQGAALPRQQAQGTPPHGTPVHGYGAPGRGRPAPGVPPVPDGWQQSGTPSRGVPRSGGQPQGAPGSGGQSQGAPGYGGQGQGAPGYGDGTPPRGVPQYGEGTPAHGFPRHGNAAPAQGPPRPGGGPPPQGGPRHGDGTPPHGVPGYGGGTPPHGVPGYGGGTPPHGALGYGDGTPPHGVPRSADGTPAHGTPRVRGGHPEQQETGGGWGNLHGRTAAGAGYSAPAAGQGVPLPRQRQAPVEGPRRDYVEAFDESDDLFTPRKPVTRGPADPYAAVTDWDGAPDTGVPSDTDTDTNTDTDAVDDEPPTGVPAQTRGGKGRAFTGIAAAAVTTVLAVVVAGQVADEHDSPSVQSQSAGEQARDARESASRGDDRATPDAPTAEPLTYEQQMDRRFPLAATRAGTGTFYAVKGIRKAPGKGRKVTYRVDVERGLDLDGALFAEAVHRTLNDRRSWAHDGLAFERIETGDAEFVITLASPETTADWCAKSGLDTTEDNVSCDSAATERVMINAYRWAQGAETYGDKMFAYRQMLINHEIGHRLGHNHVTCDKDGDLAPVMQQQTKFLEYGGISCRPNAWPYPKG